MNDTPERRTAKRFKPPPWERARIEELQRVRQEAREETEITETPVSTPERVMSPEDPRIAAMIMQLSVEEPAPSKVLWKVGALSAVLLASIGVMLVVWGVIATARTASAGIAGVTGGAILIGFGTAFVGSAGWIIIRSLKQRGVRSRG